MQIILLSVHPGKAGLRGSALERKRMLFVLRRGAGLLRPLQRGGRRTFRFPVLRQPVFLRCKALSRLCAALLQLRDAGLLRRELLCELFRLLCAFLVLSVHALEVRAAVFEVCAQHRNAARLPGLAALRLAQRRAQRFGLAVDAMQISRQLLRLLIAPLLLGFCIFQLSAADFCVA